MANIKERLAKDGTKRYTCDIRLKGHPPQRATFKRLTDAKKWIQDTESAIREGRHFKTVEGKKHTVSELIDRYCIEYLPNNKERVYSLREQKERIQKLGWWNTKIGYLVLADVSPQIIDEHLSSMTQSNATATKYLKNLSHAFSIAVKKWGWVNENPALKVIAPQQPPGRVRFLDEDERARLLKYCQESPNKTLYPCVILALSTGMRQGELMGLTWQDVNLKDGVIILQTTKNGERRRVAVMGLALELLRDHAKIRRIDTNLLFPSPTKPQQPIELKKAWLNALIRAEISDFHWHDLRHCTASYLAMNGASLTEIAEVLGHKTLSMVKRYSHLSDSHVSNVVASMNEKIFGGQ
jgi:integrase